eukprot:scaffold4349_cov19-Tisochrysis_lutea.AAC.3
MTEHASKQHPGVNCLACVLKCWPSTGEAGEADLLPHRGSRTPCKSLFHVDVKSWKCLLNLKDVVCRAQGGRAPGSKATWR